MDGGLLAEVEFRPDKGARRKQMTPSGTMGAQIMILDCIYSICGKRGVLASFIKCINKIAPADSGRTNGWHARMGYVPVVSDARSQNHNALTGLQRALALCVGVLVVFWTLQAEAQTPHVTPSSVSGTAGATGSVTFVYPGGITATATVNSAGINRYSIRTASSTLGTFGSPSPLMFGVPTNTPAVALDVGGVRLRCVQ